MSASGSVEDHVLLIPYGTGANGKSVILNTIRNVLGPDYAMAAPPNLLMARGHSERHPTEQADLKGRRFVSCIETADGCRLNESLVKTMCGGDNIRARRMRQDFEEFSPTHTIWLATNHRPIIKGNDHGIWRRIRLIPFTESIPETEQDGRLPEKLTAEASGILNWILAGAIEWQTDGLGECESVRAATSKYQAEMDVIGSFIEVSCIVGPSYRIKARELFSIYKTWAEDNREQIISEKAFSYGMEERGFEKKKDSSMVYLGITQA